MSSRKKAADWPPWDFSDEGKRDRQLGWEKQPVFFGVVVESSMVPTPEFLGTFFVPRC